MRMYYVDYVESDIHDDTEEFSIVDTHRSFVYLALNRIPNRVLNLVKKLSRDISQLLLED